LSDSANTIACSGGKVNLPVAGSYSRYPDAAWCQLVAYAHQRRAQSAAEIAQDFAYECVQLRLIDHARLLPELSEVASSSTTWPRRDGAPPIRS
jgi:hypothetical protein